MIKRKSLFAAVLSLGIVLFSGSAVSEDAFGDLIPMAKGNNTVDDFREAKKILETRIYRTDSERRTLYCGYRFDKSKNIELPSGFRAEKHVQRASRVEWEHVVPAENFGRSFKYWREGSDRCKNAEGHYFKGRRCAEKLSREYRLMQADMHNLYPSVGAVNAARLNYEYAVLPDAHSSFGSCEMKISHSKAEPPERSRGMVARSMLYMDEAYYPVFRLSKKQKKLAEAWDREWVPTQFECTRAERIAEIQKNENGFVARACRRENLRYSPKL